MKKTGFLAASVAAAAATPIVFCNTSWRVSKRVEKEGERDDSSSDQRSESTDKFAPRFDGLKFIETLVTAHR